MTLKETLLRNEFTEVNVKVERAFNREGWRLVENPYENGVFPKR